MVTYALVNTLVVATQNNKVTFQRQVIGYMLVELLRRQAT